MNTIWKHPFFAVLIFFMGISSLADSKGGGGYDASYKGSPVLYAVVKELAEELRQLPQIRLEGVPREWTPDRIAKVIEKLQVNSSPESLFVQHEGRMKILDFSKKNGTITALAGFFLYFSHLFENADPSPKQFNQIKEKLLHEVSHLWGNNDRKASQFASRTMFWIDKNVIACNYEDQGETKSFYYGLSSKKAGFSHDEVDLDTDDNGYPEVGDLNYTYSATYGSHQMNADFITVSYSFMSENVRLKVGRKTSKDAVSDGTLSFYDTISGSVKTFQVTCVIPAISILR